MSGRSSLSGKPLLQPIVRVTQRHTLCGAHEVELADGRDAGLRQVPQVERAIGW